MVPGDYTVTETNPSNWYTVGPFSKTQTLVSGGSITFDFGDFCLGAGGGLTLGFWSNKNGQVCNLHNFTQTIHSYTHKHINNIHIRTHAHTTHTGIVWS